MGRVSEHERDARDLRILQLLDQGLPQSVIAQRLGMNPGHVSKRIKELREAVK